MALLPRQCPLCGGHTIIGHGRRLRPAHDAHCRSLWVRRGLCRPCGKAFTILPDWLVPFAPYTLRCRQQACERIAAGDPLEQAAPHCRDPERLSDPSTLHRWAQRRLLSVGWWCKTGLPSEHFLQSPTIVAWDFVAFSRNLRLEARSP